MSDMHSYKDACGSMIIERALGEDTLAKLAGVIEKRKPIMEMSQRNVEAVLKPRDPGGVSFELRAILAARIANGSGEPALAAFFLEGIDAEAEQRALADGTQYRGSDTALEAMVRHVDLVTAKPWMAEREEIQALVSAGVSEADIVRLSQLAACVSYIVRVVIGLRLLGEAS